MRKHVCIVLVGLLPVLSAGGQTIARIDENDSLIINKKLDKVVVLSDRIDQNQGDQNTTIFSENVEEHLELKQGVSLTRRGNYASEITMRGLNSDRLAVTIDGMKIFSACTDKMDPVSSYVSSNNLKEAHCQSGSGDQQYQNNTGGQVNFKLKEPQLNDPKPLRFGISSGYQDNPNGWLTSFNANYSQKKWALRVNGMLTENDSYYGGGGEYVPYSQYSKQNFGLGFKGKLSNTDYIIFDYIHDDAYNVGYPALPMDVAYAKARIYSLTYKKYLTGISGKLTGKIYGNNIRHLMDDSQREVVMHMDMPGQSDTYGMFWTLESKMIERHNINITIDAYQNRSFAEMTMFPENEKEMYMLTWPDVQREMIGVFISDNFELTQSTSLNAQFRYDIGQSNVLSTLGRKQFEIFGFYMDDAFQHRAISTGVGMTKSFDDKNSLNFDVNYAERLPNVSEQFGFYIFNSMDGFDYLGDPEIENERALKTSLAHNFSNKDFQTSVCLFYSHLPNYIMGIVDEDLDAMTLGANGVKRYENLPYANMAGFEWNVNWQINKNVHFNTGFSYTYGVDQENRYLPLIPPLKNLSSVELDVKRNVFILETRSAMAQDNVSELAGESTTPGYAILNLMYKRVVNIKAHTLVGNVGVNNLFDTYYYDHLDWNAIPRVGRNFFIKLQYHFN